MTAGVPVTGLLILALLWSPIAFGADHRPPKRVLILHSFGRDFAPFNAVSSGFRTALAEQWRGPVDFHEASLDTARLKDDGAESPLVDYLHALFAKRRLDLVVPIGGPAAHFWLRYRERIVPSTPAMITGVDRRLLKGMILTPGETALTIALDPPAIIENILRVLPETATIAMVLGDSPLERFWVAELQRELQPFAQRVRFAWLNTLSFEEIRSRVATLPPHSAIFYGAMFVDGAGVSHAHWRTLDGIRAVANAPVFGAFDTQLGRGIVGGPLVPTEALGSEAARIAVRILSGEAPSTIRTAPFVSSTSAYDWRELERWRIGEERLPPGSRVKFRPATYWDLYRGRIVAVLGLCVVEAILIFVLLVQRQRLGRTQLALRESERNMGLAANAAKLALWVWDARQDDLWITDDGRALFGWSKSEPINLERFIATLHPDYREAMQQAIRRSLDSGGDYESEYRVMLADGTERWIAGRGNVEFDNDGRPARVRGVSMDITARKRAEAEAQSHRYELAHINRSGMLGELSASLAHELNQPLTAILSNAQAALRFLHAKSADTQELREILQDIVKDDRRANDVIRRLRALFKRDEAKYQVLVLNEVVREVLKLLHSDLITRHVTVTAELCPELPPIRGDRVQLQQVLLNLIFNACDAMADTKIAERRLTVHTQGTDEGAVRVSVADRGVGIPPDRIEAIFEPFVTTKAHGIGMGLAISRSIITAHGGRVWAAANPDGGTTFFLDLPPYHSDRM